MKPTWKKVIGMRARALRVRSAVLIVATLAIVGASALVALSADGVTATIGVGDTPTAVAVDPLSGRVYVANYWGGSVSVLDGTTASNVATVPTGGMTLPIAVVVDHLLTPPRVFLGNWWDGSLLAIDASTNEITATLHPIYAHAGGGPRALALDAGVTPHKLFAAVYGADTVKAYDAQTGAELASIGVGSSPRALALYPGTGSSRRLYVVNRFSDSVTVINAKTDVVVGTVPVAPGAKSVAVDPDSGDAYVTSESGVVTVIDTGASVVATIAAGAVPKAVAVDATRDRVFVANSASADVTVIDTVSHLKVGTVSVGTTPCAIAVDDTASGKTYVANQGSGSVSIIDASLAATNIGVGLSPVSIALDTASSPHRVYVANYGSDSVSVIEELPALGALAPDAAHAAGADAVLIVADPPLASPEGGVVVTGRAFGLRSPVPLGIEGVLWRPSDETEWRRADVVAGLGTPEATWSITAEPEAVARGAHAEILAFDGMGAIATNSDGGVGSVSADGGTRLSVALAVADTTPPSVSAYLTRTSVAVNKATVLRAHATDEGRGDSVVSLEYAIDAGPYAPMLAWDGSFDSSVETATAVLRFVSAGTHTVLVRGRDAEGNVSDPLILGVRVTGKR